MSRLSIISESRSEHVMEGLYADIDRRLASSPLGLCPVDMTLNFVNMCHSQSCGKCAPCRIGLGTLGALVRSVLEGKATEETLTLIQGTAESIVDSADCAIGFDAARLVLDSVHGFRDDFLEHITRGRCLGDTSAPVPCTRQCPAHVDVPGYIALINAGRAADAVRLIRKDNPFPVTCGYICEHPCEENCRRGMLDAAINIRGLKRYAADSAGVVPAPDCAESTGKRVAIIGGGPGGLTAAYYLKLMGHDVTVFERQKKLGGMLRYGIPSYRFPRELLDRDIDCILSTGVEVRCEVDIGTDIKFEDLMRDYDSVFISVGAHSENKLRVEGENLKGVISAVQLLRGIGDNTLPSFEGKKVAVIGGGNVAMDAARTAIRLGAEMVSGVYRRRRLDMTALSEEVEGAIAEGVQFYTMRAPVKIEGDENGNVKALYIQPQIPGELGDDGRPMPRNSSEPVEKIDVDIVITAVGQKIESDVYERAGIPTNRGMLVAMSNGQIFKNGKVFAGGDCATGPASAIRAIAAGKVVAANIDTFLGGNHEIEVDVKVPSATLRPRVRRGRINMALRPISERTGDFDCIECSMTEESASLEASRCLRCDHYGYGAFRGGRIGKW